MAPDHDPDALARRWLPYARRAAGEWGGLALAEAIRGYDPAVTPDFRARLAWIAARRRVDAHRDRRNRPLRQLPRVRDCHGDERECEPAAPPVAPVPDPADFERLIRPVPARHRDLFRLVYRDGLTVPAAAARVGLSTTRACALHARYLVELRWALR